MQWDDYTSKAAHSSDRWATSDRGWLYAPELKGTVANYLDYGPDHYRSPHQDGEREPCRACEAGNVHVCVYRCPQDFRDYGQNFGWRWCETVAQAKAWAEDLARENKLGTQPAAVGGFIQN